MYAVSDDDGRAGWLLVSKQRTQQQSPYYIEQGGKTEKKNNNSAVSKSSLLDFQSITADTVTNSSHREKQAINHYQQSFTPPMKLWSHPTVNQLHLHHNDFLMQYGWQQSQWAGFVKWTHVSSTTSYLTKFHLKPSGNNHTVVSAKHPSYCWSGKAPRRHIADGKREFLLLC